VHEEDADESADGERGLSTSEELASSAGTGAWSSFGDIVDKVPAAVSLRPSNDNNREGLDLTLQ
jgi:hypothetical protein